MNIEWERAQAEKGRTRKIAGYSIIPEAESLLKLKPLLTERQFLYFSLSSRGLSGKDIAEIFCVSPGAVSHGISRAKKRLAAAITAGEVFAQNHDAGTGSF